jgi:hypothetical protein
MSLSLLFRISQILKCSPKDLMSSKTTYNRKSTERNHLTSSFGQLRFSVEWIARIFRGKRLLYDDNHDLMTNRDKAFVISAAHNNALIMLAELWNASGKGSDDVTMTRFFKAARTVFKGEDKQLVQSCKERFDKVKENHSDLLKRLRLVRNKSLAHLTGFEFDTMERTDSYGNKEFFNENVFTWEELSLLIDTLVMIFNKLSTVMSVLGRHQIEEIPTCDQAK